MTKNYIICTLNRTGGTYLERIIGSTEVAGRPGKFILGLRNGEYQEMDAAFFESIRAKGSTENGVFGMQLTVTHLPALLEACDGDIASVFPGVRYVYLTRCDKVKQAISWAKANTTGQWESADPMVQGPEYLSMSEIMNLLRHILFEEYLWERFFAEQDITPHRIFYEDFEQVSEVEATLTELLSFLGIDVPDPLSWSVTPAMEKLYDANSEKWYQRVTAYLKEPFGL